MQPGSHRPYASEVADLTTAIFDTMWEGLVVLDEGDRVQMVNAAFCRMSGLASEDAVGRPLAEIGNGQWNAEPLARALDLLSRTGAAEHEAEELKAYVATAG